MKTKKLTNQIQAFSETYDNLTDCFGGNLPVESLAEFSGLPLGSIKALVICKDIERSIEKLDRLLLKDPTVSALGFTGSGRAHLINIADDDTFFITYQNFDVFENEK
ncbi:MAG: hypothetical protein ABFC90_07325 [Bacteroidales bacterium]|nr:hypothetical protein [Bacteroidales bacterium]